MSKRNYVKLVFTDKEGLSEFGPDLAKLSFVLTREWANIMSQAIKQLLTNPDELNTLSDIEIVDLLENVSESVLESIARGILAGSGNDVQAVSVIDSLIRKSINEPQEMLEVLSSRTAGVSPAIALAHNYPYILMKVGNVADVEFALHFDLNEFETFFVKENDLSSVVEALKGFPLDAEDKALLAGEDFYDTLADDTLDAANDEEYGEDDVDVDPFISLLKQFENMHNANMASPTGLTQEFQPADAVPEELVEETQEIEYAARVYNIFGDLEDERTGHAGQLEDLIAWASSLAKLDGLRYDISRVVTRTRVTVSEELINA